VASTLKTVAEILGFYPQTADVNQLPYCFSDTVVMWGVPPIKLSGLDSVKVRYLTPRVKRFSSLGGGGCFLGTRSTAGEINLRFGQGMFSVAHVELLSGLGFPVPMVITDISSGGTASIVATACRLVDTGEFVREGEAPLIDFKFETERMIMFHGLRLPVFEN
jgi:hypothetical protein